MLTEFLDIISLTLGVVVVAAGVRFIYVLRKERKEREERHRLAMERLADMKRELDEKMRKANSAPISKVTKTTDRYIPSNGYAPARRATVVDNDDDSLATMILMNQISNNNMPVFVDTTPAPSYSYSSSSDDSCSRSSYDSSSSSSSYSSYSSDSSSSYSSSDSGSSSSGCD